MPLPSEAMTRNPTWTYEELTLAVDLIDRRNWIGGGSRTPEIIALSDLLRAANFPDVETVDARFRSPGSISMKIGNLKGANPRVQGGLRVTKREVEVVEHFLANREIMRALANSLRQNVAGAFDLTGATGDTLDDIEVAAAIEGGPRYVLTVRRERSGALRREKIAQAKRRSRQIRCEVCGFSFLKTYGVLGEDYIEVHHRTPLYVSGEVGSSIHDLALLCANCHRMIHRRGWIGVEELAAIYDKVQSETAAQESSHLSLEARRL